MNSKTIFGSLSAQHDNLGDIAIRQLFFKAFADAGNRLVLLTHKMPPTYIDMFDLGENVQYVSSPIKFQLQLIRRALMGRAHLVYAPGPHSLIDSPQALVKTAVMLANSILIRATGGVIQTAGRAVRGKGQLASAMERGLVALMANYVVRDSTSESVVGLKLVQAPDLALGRFSYGDTIRPHVSCSFRSDTPVDSSTFGQLVKQFKGAGYELVLVSQVRRDDLQHEKLAREFGLKTLLWGTKSHAEQQIVVDKMYKSSYAVVSNRLHGLIFGIAAGAIPVEYRIGQSDKIVSTLAPWFGDYPVVHNATATSDKTQDVISLEELMHMRKSLNRASLEARKCVSGVLAGLAAMEPMPTSSVQAPPYRHVTWQAPV